MNIDTIKNKLTYNTTWQLCLIILLPLIIYIGALKYEFIGFDDTGIILDKFAIMGDIKNLPKAFTTDAFLNPHGDFYRPIQTATFMIDAFISRENPWMYHLSNIIIHILTCVSLYYFLLLFDLKKLTAFLLSLFFAAHPLFATAVAWVPSRGDLLIGLLGLQLFISFVKYFQTKKILWFIFHFFVFLIITFTKETTVLFPLFLLYYYFLIFKQNFNFKKEFRSLKELIPFFAVWIIVFVGYFLMRRQVVENTTTADVFGIIPFFKNNQVVPTIIGKFFVPYHLSTLPLYENFGTIVGIIFLLAVTYLTFEYTKEKKWAALMGLGWFLLFIVPPTIYRLDNADTFFNYLEHRTYLPIIGLMIIIGFFVDDLLSNPKRTTIFIGIFIPVLLIFSCLAWDHSNDYKNNFSFAYKAASLNNATGYTMRGARFLEKGDTSSALGDFNKAIVLNPNANAYFERGKMRAKAQDHVAAEQDFSMSLSLNPGLVDAYLARSVERRILKKYESAFRDIHDAAKYDSTNPKIYFSFGNLFIATNNYNDAIASFSKAILLKKDYGEAYNNRAYSKLQIQDYNGTLQDCDSAIRLMPKNAVAHNNMAQAYRELNIPTKSFEQFEKALALNPNFSDGYYERAKAKLKFNDKEGACKDWNEALKLKHADAQAMIDKNCKK